MKLAVIARAVVVAYHGGAADGVADEDGGEDHADVHHHAVGGDAVIPGVLDKLEVIEHAHKAHGHVAHEFGRAVGACPQKRLAVVVRSAEAQDAGIPAREVHERDAPADDLTERRGDRRPGELMLLRQRHNEHRVQHHVRHTRRDRHDKSEMRLLRRDKKALKEILHHDERQRAQHDAPVDNAVFKYLTRRAEKRNDRADEDERQHTEHHAQPRGDVDEEREIAVRALTVALTERIRDNGGAARAEHEAHRGHYHQKRPGEVDRFKRNVPGEIRHEEPVHHAVDRREYHHGDGR